MSWWPGWDSIDSTAWWSSFYFWLGIAALFVLGISEVVSHYYGLRNGELVGISERTAVQQRQEAEQRHQQETERLGRELAEAKAAMEPRHLSAEQRDKLVAALARVPKFPLSIKAGSAGGDERRYAEEIAEALGSVGWKVQIDNALLFGNDVTGLWLVIYGGGKVGAPVPNSVISFRDAFIQSGLAMREPITADPGAPARLNFEVWLQIGMRKPPA
jgi:hypothetical protein